MEVKINEIVNKLSQDYQEYGATIQFEKDETLKKYRENFIEKFFSLITNGVSYFNFAHLFGAEKLKG